MNMPQEEWLRILTPGIESRLGKTRHALFDFDGTVSVMREGWEGVMLPVMLESICGTQPVPQEIDAEVREYIDHSTGTLTIQQMEWLAQAVRRYGMVKDSLTAAQYKAIYLERLMVRVGERSASVRQGRTRPEEMMLAGAADFVKGLWSHGVVLYLASGTDHLDMLNEVTVLGMARYFAGGVYGALDQSEANGKERVIQRILDEHHLAGDELLVVGDGPVEIREAKARGAISLGVASDEISRSGWNQHKVQRLAKAGVDLIIPDFTHGEDLLRMLVSPLEKGSTRYDA
jgi:phosphoglycolate phosphatase-like HAD superfamily hydrolase